MSELGAKDTQGGGVHTWIHVRATSLGLPLWRREGASRSQAAHHGGDSARARRQGDKAGCLTYNESSQRLNYDSFSRILCRINQAVNSSHMKETPRKRFCDTEEIRGTGRILGESRATPSWNQ